MTKVKAKILCAEDEIDIRENIVDILIDEGFEVLSASDGAKAFKILEDDNDIDLVVSDIMMPNLSGLELLSKVRNSKFKNCNIPFLLLTALSTKEDVIKGTKLGANDYIIKPIDFDILVAKINEKISNAQMVSNKFENRIQNIKDQISNIVPNNMMDNVKIINHIADILRSEPYGPFSHKKYLSDIERIYNSSLKLTALINNYLHGENVENSVEDDSTIHNPAELIENTISTLPIKLQELVHFNIEEDVKIPKIKINADLIIESIKKTLSVLLRSHPVNIDINIVFDYLDRVVFILTIRDYLKNDDVSKQIEAKSIPEKLRESEYDFDIIFNNGEYSALIFIPAYRVITN